MAATALFDHLDAEGFAPLGDMPIVWIDCTESGAERRARGLAAGSQAIVAGFDARGLCPAIDPAPFDLLLTARTDPPIPWIWTPAVDRQVAAITVQVAGAPIAAAVTARVLRINAALPFADALHVESLAYSTLLGGAEFRSWRAARPASVSAGSATGPFVHVSRDDNCVTITLARPDRRNALCAGMRDALHEALCAVLDDPSAPDVVLRAEGPCFSTGGALGEFGTADDLAQAHAIRTLRSCAARFDELGARATVLLHGACIGSGIEMPAAAAIRRALPGAFFQLPELAMGLMPGAGGTASIARAIGRHRACYMVMSGRRISRDIAAGWGLVDRVAA